MRKSSKKKAILCDIDGTLALFDRDPFDLTDAMNDGLNHPIAHILEVYDNQTLYDVDLLLVTGRMETEREVTKQWLRKQKITHYKALYMRPEHDFRKDYVVKKEVYEKHIEPEYEVLFVLEDRAQVVKMWRGLGLTVLQVAEGDF